MHLEEVDFKSAEMRAQFADVYPEGTRGIYQPSDLSKLELSGNKLNQKIIVLNFVPC